MLQRDTSSSWLVSSCKSRADSVIGRTVANPHRTQHTVRSRVAPKRKTGEGEATFSAAAKMQRMGGGASFVERRNNLIHWLMTNKGEKHCDVQRNTNARIEIITSLETLSISKGILRTKKKPLTVHFSLFFTR